MAENKTKATRASVSAFIAAISDDTKRADAKTLVKLMQAATGEKPKLWGPSIIGFGMHHYVYESGREGDMPVIGFSPRKPALVLYLTPFKGSDALLKKLGPHTSGKACLYVKTLADVDAKILKQLIEKSAAATPSY
ncbi:MAG: DUF1801 domain-containing protein [Pseudomonadota bacterium]